MKAPLSWIKEYVDITCTPDELKDKLFSCGFEVEEMTVYGGNIDKIVTCKILSIEKHPNADKLSVTKVDAGKYGVLQIITAAKNIFVGATVPVALDGSTLFNGEHIYNGELRGLPSFGMFCSGEELGINDDFYEGASVDGILILKEDYPLGEEVKTLLGIEDVIFDINVTANRPDCQSVYGIAREVSAVLGKPLKPLDISFTADKSVSTQKAVKVSCEDAELCPRYISHFIKDVRIGQSPAWMKKRLFRMGIRSINNIVDITNYVLTEVGQPMHAFDLKDLQGEKIIVRRADEGEKIITLDEKEFTLSKENLVICDAFKPVCLAGVMGGLNSGIKDDTKGVVFEAAKFARDNIRRTSRALGQRSDSSSRFEKGVDDNLPEIGMKRALHLICQLNCGTVACDEYDIYPNKKTAKVIETTVKKVNGVLGIDVSAEEMKSILTRLFFDVETDGDKLKVTVPLFREDVEDYPDIAEELIREYGYDHITPTLLKTAEITSGGKNFAQKKADALKELMVSYGFNEMINYSFVSEKEYDLFDLDKGNGIIKIINPIGEDMAVMRTSLFPSAIRAAVYNINRKNFDGRLFELAKTYISDEVPLKSDLPEEREVLSFALFGEKEDFFTAKGVVEGILSNFCYGQKAEYKPSKLSRLHPGRAADVYINGEKVGYFGELNPEIAEKLDVDKRIYAGEIYYGVLSKYFVDKIVFKNISKFPVVQRDIAVIIDEDVPCDKVESVIRENGGEYLTDLSLFDVYLGEQIEKGKKSMAFNMLFVSDSRTLNVEEIDKTMKDILSALEEKCGAKLR